MRIFGQFLWLIIIITLIALTISFVTSNEPLITLYLWPFDGALTAPTWLLILSSFIIGGLLSVILLWAQWLAIRVKLWRLQGKLNKLQRPVTAQHNSKTADFGLQDQQSLHDISKPLRTGKTLRK